MNILRRLWSIWFGLVFFVASVLATPCHHVLLRFHSRRTHRMAHQVNVGWGWLILTFGLMKVRRHWQGNVPRDGTYVFVANHRSYLDIPVTHLALPFFFRYIGKAELARMPLFGFMYSRLHILVDRSSQSDRSRSLHQADERLQAGDNIFIFPEGTSRHPSPRLLRDFKDGAFVLAIQNRTPIVPVTIINSSRALSNDGRFLMRPFVTIQVYIDAPVDTTGYDLSQVEVLKARIHAQIQANLDAFYAQSSKG